MLERLLFLSAFAALLAIGLAIARAWLRRQTRRLRSGPASALWDVLGERPDHRPIILAFSTKGCAVCSTAQAPALEAVERRVGSSSVRILKVDAGARPDLVKAFSVLTAPSTLVFTADGQLCAYNRGFATADRLVDQLRPNRFGSSGGRGC
jgi:thiol:disulfide interchange protein